MTALEGAYRRRLWAYPRGPRREELLGTLLDAAPPGRARPTARETINLARCGIRARLGRPASRWVVVAAVLIALTTGYFAAALAARYAWEAAPGYPTGARLAEITGSVFPGRPPDGELDGDGVLNGIADRSAADVLTGGYGEDYGFAEYRFDSGELYLPGDYRVWTEEAARRLTAAGWRIRGVHPLGGTDASGAFDEDSRRLWADRDGLSLLVEASDQANGGPAGTFTPTATLRRYTPGVVTLAATVAFLPGALLGWLLTGWVCRRTDHRADVRTPMAGLTVLALLLLAPQALVGVAGIVDGAMRTDWETTPFWSLSLTWGYGCTVLGLLLAAAPVVIAARNRGRADAPAAR